MEQAPRADGSGARGSACSSPGTRPPDEVPEVADAVGARALDLRRMAEQVRAEGGDDLACALRAHAGHVDALAEHLRDAGSTGPPPSTGPP